MNTVDIISEYIGLVVILFMLSMICERLSDFLKNFLSEANANNGIGLKLRKLLYIGNLVQKGSTGSLAEERRAYRVLKINLFCGFFTSWALHADLFSILKNKTEPFHEIGWNKILWIWDKGFEWDIAGGFVFLIGCFATGFFISFGSKFWHDLLDILYQIKNVRRVLADPETYKTDNIQVTEQTAATYPSAYINAAYLAAKQKLMVNQNVKSVCLKSDSSGFYFEVSVQQQDNRIGDYYTYYSSPGVGQSIRIAAIVLGKDVIRAHSIDLSSRIFGASDPDNWGTLGCIVKSLNKQNKTKYILTCSHNVLDPVKDLPLKTSETIQVCSNNPETIVGKVFKAERDREIDAALIELDNTQFKKIINQMPNMGSPKGIRSLFNRDVNKLNVCMYGARSKFKQGKVVGVYCDVQVTYSEDEFKLINLIAVSNEGEGLSEGGDSGSVVMDDDLNIIGLVVAGSPFQTYIMPIDTVFQKLEIDLYT